MVDDKKRRLPQEPQVQDVSRVLQDATTNLIELDARLQQMRRDISGLLQGAAQAGTPPMQSHTMFQGGVPFPTMPVPEAAWRGAAPFPATGQAMGVPAPSGGMFGGPSPPPGAWSVRDFRSMPPRPREPQADVIDAGAEFILQMEMPGVRKEDLDIMATERAVVITAEYRPEMDDSGVVVLGERGPIAYRRTFPLPIEIHSKECQATLKDGLLTLRVPKKSPSDGAHHVNVAYS